MELIQGTYDDEEMALDLLDALTKRDFASAEKINQVRHAKWAKTPELKLVK